MQFISIIQNTRGFHHEVKMTEHTLKETQEINDRPISNLMLPSNIERDLKYVLGKHISHLTFR
jgi:hypothetical protein